MALTPNQVKECHKRKVSLRHPKTPDAAYIIVGIGQMKSEGKWSFCATYMNVKTKDSYTRALHDFGKFTAPKLK